MQSPLSKMGIAALVALVLTATHLVAGFLGYSYAREGLDDQRFQETSEMTHFDRVLDGDTVVLNGKAIRITGIDAPELGPWAKCWSEAVAANEARLALEQRLGSAKYEFQDRREHASGNDTARLVTKDGFDIADELAVAGVVAVTSENWDWCGDEKELKSPRHDDPEPHGPNLWWPTNHVYDERAAD